MEPILASVILATSTAITELPTAEIEKIYWNCEFTATQGILGGDDAAVCSELYEYLKESKFHGDFNALLIWWKQNKEQEISSRLKLQQP